MTRFRAVVVDYDGTLTLGTRPSPEVIEAMVHARAGGIKLVLATGRRVADLRHVFPEVERHVDAVVAENGGVLLRNGASRALAPPVEPALEDALNRRGVPVQAGEVLLACDAVHAVAVLEEVHRLGLDCQLVRNRAALMILPAGVGKGTGAVVALAELGVSPHVAVGIGDAENDQGLFRACEVGVAVGNAVESLKSQADLVLSGSDGGGVASFLTGPVVAGHERLLSQRRNLVVGRYDDGAVASIPASSLNVLIVGGSGTGKSTTAGLLVEQLARAHYAVLVIDQEGDHVGLGEVAEVLTFGAAEGLPAPGQVMALLRRGATSVVLDLSGDGGDGYLDRLLRAVVDCRGRWGAPQWLFVDEAHRALALAGARGTVASGTGTCLITWRPESIDPAVLTVTDAAIVFPDDGAIEPLALVVSSIGEVDGAEARRLLAAVTLGQAVLVTRVGPRRAAVVELADRSTPHVRHARKYADVPLPVHLRFVFRRPGGEPTGRVAANLHDLHDVLGGCDADVLRHHLGGRDLSRWALSSLQDPELAAAFAAVEDRDLPVEQARRRILRSVEERYLRR